MALKVKFLFKELKFGMPSDINDSCDQNLRGLTTYKGQNPKIIKRSVALFLEIMKIP